MNNNNLYGVKIIYTYSVGNKEQKFYEEQILSVQATSFDDAYNKAEQYAKEQCDEHINPNGELVRTQSFELVDCFMAFDDEDGVQEIYSSITKNTSKLDEAKYYEILTKQLAKEELYELRYAEFN